MSRRKPKGPLRKGWTTGACATAAARAAYQALLTGDFPDPVTITLPRGERPSFPLSRACLEDGRASAGVIKDAGDDPDVTHGAEIISAVAPGPPGSGVTFASGPGVGTVTLAGLPVAVGEAAINPAPRRMMTGAVTALAREFGRAPADVRITVSIPGGEELALRTTNGRLGIEGGLSVLGTTGIVIPYSCASWIHSIQGGVDVCRAAGIGHIAGCTGRTSEESGEENARVSRDRLHGHGGLRRRAAQVPAPEAGGAPHHRRRLRQDVQARRRSSRPTFLTLGGGFPCPGGHAG